jgi:hypothetical protein
MSEAGGAMKLPIRLVPRRSGGIVMALALPAIGVFVLGRFVGDLLDELRWTDPYQVFMDQPALIIALAIGSVVLLWMETFAILRILPGGPYFHLDITVDGLKRHEFRTEKFFAWNEIGSLDVVGRMQGSKKRRMHYWLLVEGERAKADENDDGRKGVDRRIKNALLAYDTDELSPMFANNQKVADDLLRLLKAVRADRLNGIVPDDVQVPALLGDVVVTPSKTRPSRRNEAAVAKPRRSGGVVER